ncbi:hypothetical protein [Terrisporobacter mayombei]|nr:hypothetical protein [Terrisporobacter mayombei]
MSSMELIESLNKSYKLAIVTNDFNLIQDERIRKSVIKIFINNSKKV